MDSSSFYKLDPGSIVAAAEDHHQKSVAASTNKF